MRKTLGITVLLAFTTGFAVASAEETDDANLTEMQRNSDSGSLGLRTVSPGGLPVAPMTVPSNEADLAIHVPRATATPGSVLGPDRSADRTVGGLRLDARGQIALPPASLPRARPSCHCSYLPV